MIIYTFKKSDLYTEHSEYPSADPCTDSQTFVQINRFNYTCPNLIWFQNNPNNKMYDLEYGMDTPKCVASALYADIVLCNHIKERRIGYLCHYIARFSVL